MLWLSCSSVCRPVCIRARADNQAGKSPAKLCVIPPGRSGSVRRVTISLWLRRLATLTLAFGLGAAAAAHAVPAPRPISAAQARETLPFAVALRMRDLAGLQARVARGERIPRAELEARYLPLPGDYEAVTQWMAAQGFEVTARDPARLGVFARAAVGRIGASLGVGFASVAVDGQERPSATGAPTWPAGIAPAVLGVQGLQPRRARRPHVRQPLVNNAPAYFPGEILKAYHGAALAVNGTPLTGAGETIAIVIDAPPAAADLTQFWSAVGVPQSLANVSFVQVGGGPPGPPNSETTLDAEWTSGMAPGARIRVYCAGSLEDAALDQCFQQILADLPSEPSIHQVSISLGLGETYLDAGQLDADAQYFAALASQGVTVVVSSGDGGSTPDDLGSGPGNTGPLQAESYASDPSVTAVGGTSLALDPATGLRASEAAWPLGGGGTSLHFPRPAWQTGPGVPPGPYRLVPDLSLPADPAKGAYVVYGGVARKYGGTSWGAPTLAGFCALINQGRALQGMAPVGLLNPLLYPLGGGASFYDVTSGNNAGGPQSGGSYAATPGYDEVTGLGAPDFGNLLTALTTPPPAASGVVISQVYGGGGGTGATYKNDFIELYNRGDAAVDLGAWSVQYTSGGGNVWQQTDLTGAVIQPHGYYLIKERGNTAANAPGLPLPTPGLTGNIDLNAVDGKVALRTNADPLPGIADPRAEGGVVDFVGYGAANAAEGGAPAPALSTRLAALRRGGGATDTQDNAADFTAAAPAPRNSLSPANVPDLSLALTHAGNFKQADAAGVCTLLMSNGGIGPTAGLVSVRLTLPPAFMATGLSGEGWIAGADLQSALRRDSLAPGAGYPALTLTVQVAADAPASVVNRASISGGGESNTANDDASDSIPVAALSAAESWRYRYFGIAGNTGPAADGAIASGDGLPNLLKYALGLDPRVPAMSPVAVDRPGGRLRLAVARNPAATDLVFAAEVTGDLSAWSAGGAVIDVNSSTSFQAHDTGVGNARFIRLRVTRP